MYYGFESILEHSFFHTNQHVKETNTRMQLREGPVWAGIFPCIINRQLKRGNYPWKIVQG